MSTSCRKMLFLLSYALQPVEQCKQGRDEEQEFESSRVSCESSETGWLNIAAGETEKQRTNVPYVSSVPGHTGPGQKRYTARKSLASLQFPQLNTWSQAPLATRRPEQQNKTTRTQTSFNISALETYPPYTLSLASNAQQAGRGKNNSA